MAAVRGRKTGEERGEERRVESKKEQKGEEKQATYLQAYSAFKFVPAHPHGNPVYAYMLMPLLRMVWLVQLYQTITVPHHLQQRSTWQVMSIWRSPAAWWRGLHLKPSFKRLQLRQCTPRPQVHVPSPQARLIVGKAHQSAVHRIGRQLLAPALAGAPIAPLVVPAFATTPDC